MANLANSIRLKIANELKNAKAYLPGSGYCHDLEIYTRFEKMTDDEIERCARMATRENLELMGFNAYKVRASSGETIFPIFTVALYDIAARFGDDAVNRRGFRGVRDEQAIIDAFCKSMDEIVDMCLFHSA